MIRLLQRKLVLFTPSSHLIYTRSSITKLLAFSIALVVLPISIYFITLNSIFNGR